MCGLVSVITKYSNGFDKSQVDAFNDLLYIDALRGMDSTGVFLVDKEGNMDMAKEASNAVEFRTHADYKDILQTAFRRGRALVGHNRAATRGVVTDENAHPFVVDDRITLIHNGTLYGDWAKLANNKKGVDVDSHAIAHKIHECDNDVEKALKQVTGAFALIWHDFKKNTLNFIRNEQRPLYYAETASSWIWASEANMIGWILARHNMKAEKGIHMLTANTHVTYDFTGNSWNVSNKELDLKIPTPVFPATTYNNQQPHKLIWPDDDDMCGVVPFTPKQTATNVTRNEQVQQVQLGYDNFKARTQVTGRVIAHENDLAYRQLIDIDAQTFANVRGNIAPDGSKVLATCLDYQTINPSSPVSGFWLYATLDKDERFLIKQYMPAATVEKELMDLCINGKQGVFTVASAQWRCYTNAAHGQGLAIVNCTEVVIREPSPV